MCIKFPSSRWFFDDDDNDYENDQRESASEMADTALNSWFPRRAKFTHQSNLVLCNVRHGSGTHIVQNIILLFIQEVLSIKVS